MAKTGKQGRGERKKTDGWGVDSGYEDAFQKWHQASAETLEAVRRAMGVDERSKPKAAESQPVIVLEAGTAQKRAASASKRCGSIELEGGGSRSFDDGLPTDLPTGYHNLQFEREPESVRLIVSPGKCYLPDELRTWGWAVQLYAARSRRSWGMGDLGDLDLLARWSGSELGAGMLLLNPLSACAPYMPQQASPYYPCSRRFFNPLWISVENLPGANEENVPGLDSLAQAGRELNQARRIDRDQVFRLKMKALKGLWARFDSDPGFSSFCKEQGADLERYATFCALAEDQQSGWQAWPSEFRHPTGPAVNKYAAEHRGRVDFHKWLQWLLDVQLAQASHRVALMQDLPIGVDPGGADAWAWQDVFAMDAGVGAPPDEFNTQGQNWGLPPFVPHKLRAAGYEPFLQTLRAAFRHGGGLRIDHVMGLFRLYWIPAKMSAKDGTYVRYNADEMLAIVALESQRAKAYVVGEDLGTVEDEAREKLASHRILSYRLLWFEKAHPRDYPQEALAAITTHDLPTVAGLWTGSDLALQHRLDLTPNEQSTKEICTRLEKVAQLTPDFAMEEVIARSYELLAHAPSRIVTAALDDAAGVEERPNIPATLEDKNPNWSLALPIALDDLMKAELPRRIAAALQRNGTGAAL